MTDTVGEQKRLYVHIGGEHGGCYDVGVLKLEGFTLIRDEELALLKRGIAPAVPALTFEQRCKLGRLITAYAKACMNDSWKGSAHPDDRDRIADNVVKANKRLNDFIHKLEHQ